MKKGLHPWREYIWDVRGIFAAGLNILMMRFLRQLFRRIFNSLKNGQSAWNSSVKVFSQYQSLKHGNTKFRDNFHLLFILLLPKGTFKIPAVQQIKRKTSKLTNNWWFTKKQNLTAYGKPGMKNRFWIKSINWNIPSYMYITKM